MRICFTGGPAHDMAVDLLFSDPQPEAPDRVVVDTVIGVGPSGQRRTTYYWVKNAPPSWRGDERYVDTECKVVAVSMRVAPMQSDAQTNGVLDALLADLKAKIETMNNHAGLDFVPAGQRWELIDRTTNLAASEGDGYTLMTLEGTAQKVPVKPGHVTDRAAQALTMKR